METQPSIMLVSVPPSSIHCAVTAASRTNVYNEISRGEKLCTNVHQSASAALLTAIDAEQQAEVCRKKKLTNS